MHFKRVDKQLPDLNTEVIGFNKAWVSNYNPDGTRLCVLISAKDIDKSKVNIWKVVCRNYYATYYSTLANYDELIPTHWCGKPIPPMHLTK